MKKRSLSFITVATLILVLVISVPVWAITIPVTNASFESPVVMDGAQIAQATGWTITSSGVWNPSTAQWGASPPVPNGVQVAYAIAGGSLAQTLTGHTLLADQIYTMTVYVGTRSTGTGSALYEVALYAGTTKLASKTNATDPLTPGQFRLVTVSYTAPSSGPLLGQTLSVQLSGLTGTTRQSNFDVVTLNYVPLPPSALLLGSGLLGLRLLGWRRRKS
jgi:hypothetical protein